MKHIRHIAAIALFGSLLPFAAAGQVVPQFQDLFNGKDLSGWTNINTAEDTWKWRDGLLICSGRPIGVMRSASSTLRAVTFDKPIAVILPSSRNFTSSPSDSANGTFGSTACR